MMKFMRKLVSLLKTISHLRVAWYVLGVITPISILFILFISGVKPPLSDGDVLVSKWQIFEQSENTLLVHISGYDNVCFVVDVERNPENGLVEEISVTNGRCEDCAFRGEAKLTPEKQRLDQNDVIDNRDICPVFPVFVYKTKGRYEVPMVLYGCPDPARGLVWRDLNADNQFDQRIDYRNRRMEINVDGRWIKGKGIGKKEVVTDEGVFKFDTQSGKWKIVEPHSDHKEKLKLGRN